MNYFEDYMQENIEFEVKKIQHSKLVGVLLLDSEIPLKKWNFSQILQEFLSQTKISPARRNSSRISICFVKKII